MKRSFTQIALTAALLLTFGITTTFAANNTGDSRATVSFRKEFKQAEVLSTDPAKDYTKITFKMNGVILFAYYNDNGELLAVTHNIRPSELPINLLIQLKREHADCWVTDCFEFDADGSASYFITLENADTKLTLHSNGSDWETYSRIIKI
jgi:hypothetical protein